MKTGSWKRGLCATGVAAAVGAGALYGAAPLVAGAASSPVVVGKNVPSSAMTTKIGVTANTVSVSNISWSPIFKGADIGTEAYFDYVNSTGGVNGRKIKVTSQNTGYSGTTDA
ncbi:MAG TPA: hypothetical protein VHW47_03060, partial [Acidimicrobiales bacterium]|nr:hypothetical protein [Acidimicrobiales bacterium]